uniref:primase-helicase zinc-binding domain-containing protein n=2 Tax=Xenorhabdus bovienii TaxID=40576 RepID=UPI003BB7B5C8
MIMSQGNHNPKSRPIDVIRAVKQSAANYWQNLLPACGVDVPAKGKHGACPICGGTDRFHFIDDNHNGDWH